MTRIKFLMLMLLGFCLQIVAAQTTLVNGLVTDEGGTPLPGVSVVIEGTIKGTTTDFDGNYTIDGLNTTDQLTFSYIGMSSQTVTVGEETTINVVMQESSEALDEVIVVAYGTQSRAKVTGAISTVDSEAIEALPVTNAEQALQGRAPGVTVTNSGPPGSTPNVRIRGLGTFGNNDPLYVIDGVIVGNLSGISPNDIESVSILKDASTTALYGAQGSNGVVLVTTKSGKNGKGTLAFSSYTGFQTVVKRFDVLDTPQYLRYAANLGFTPNRSAELFTNNINYQDQIFTSGLLQNHNLSYSGGNDNGNYRFSAGYQNQEGAIINTGFKRYSFRATSSYTKGKFTVGETLSVAFSDSKPILTSGGRTLIEHAIKAAPYLPVRNSDNLGGFQGPNTGTDGQDAENPVRVQTLGDNNNRNLGVIGNIYGEYEIAEGLKFRTQVGLDFYTGYSEQFTPAFNDDNVVGSATHAQAFAAIGRGTSQGQALIFDNSLTYIKTFAERHNIEVLALAEEYKSKNRGFGANTRNTITNEIKELGDEQQSANSGSSETNRQSFLGRVNYDFDDKYLLSASFRRDASSRFGANNRWGNFPSASVGWNVAKESFMENSAFNTLKLRGSYGIVGNDKIGDYQFTSALASGFVYPINGEGAIGTTGAGLANKDLKWEETTILNVGADLVLFNNALTASAEYYQNTSDDLLIGVQLPLSSGFNSSTVTQNAGSVETQGIEFSLGYNDYEGDFTWSLNANFGTSTNEAIDLGGAEELFVGGGFEGENITRLAVGESLYHFYGLVTDGIYQNQAEVDAVFTANPDQTTVQPGDIRFKDTNGDGDITSDDRKIIGTPFPKYTYGLNLDGKYKNWDFNIFINGVADTDIYNTNIYDLQGMTRLFNSGVEVLDRWTPTNPSTTVPRALGAPQNVVASDRFVEDGSFTRLKNLSIGYTINQDNLTGYFSRLRLYVSGQNLITITDYTGLDPEIGSGGAEYGFDIGGYPQPISVLFGLEVSF